MTSEGAEQRDRHNSRKLAYNFLTILQNNDVLSTMEMDREKYIQYFLDGDEEKLSPRGKKMAKYVHLYA